MPALLVTLAALALPGCDGDWPGLAPGELPRGISPAPAGTEAALPPPSALRLELAGDHLDRLDFLALSGCALQANLGRRSGRLGARARDSQRLLLDLEYLRLAPACIDFQRARGSRALATALEQAGALKRRQLPAAIYNATLGSDEYREFWERPARAPADESSGAASAGLQAISNQARRWLAGDWRTDNREFEILLGEVGAGAGAALLRAPAAGPEGAGSEHCDLLPILELEQQLAAVLPPAYREWRGRRDRYFRAGLSPGTPCQRFTMPVSSPNRSRIRPTL